MEQLISAQEELCGRISRTLENLRKHGSAKITIALVESSLRLLDSKWEKFEKQHDQLRQDHWAELKTHDYIKLSLVSRVEDIYLEQRASLMEVKQALETNSVAEAASRHDSRGSDLEARHSLSTLPKINLPQFSGRYEDWPAFRDLFLSLIGKQDMLSNVEKLHYLKGSVSGSAVQLIQSLPVTEENFQRAWSTLSNHFENKRLLVRSCLSTFTSLPKMKSESASELRKIFNDMLATVNALDGIGRPLAGCMDIFIHLVVDLLDSRTRREWEYAVGGSTNPPAFDELRNFLERKLHNLDALPQSKTEQNTNKGEGSSRMARAHLVKSQDESRRRCPLCSKQHFIMFCDKFKSKSAEDRKETIQKLNLCFNCLGRHLVSSCGSTRTCVHCSARHHSFLHDACVSAKSETNQTASGVKPHMVHHVAENRGAVMLATARVQVADRHGIFRVARALVDPGSDVSLVAESLVQRLQLKRSAASVGILGVANMQTKDTRGQVLLSIAPRFGSSCEGVAALVLPRVTSYGQHCSAGKQSWSFLDGLELADPDFCGQSRVEILLGADIFPRLVLEGLRKGGPHEPMAQRTTLGWIILGPTGETSLGPTVNSFQCSLDTVLSADVRRFWEQEEPVRSSPPLTATESRCMEHYATTHSRREDGRYVVRLPLSSELPNLADSRRAALRMLHSTEQRFRRDDSFQRLYADFMREYEELRHMSAVPPVAESKNTRGCFLPHHGVFRESSSSTKLRVVFNGSWRTGEGHSLNEFLMVGPNLLPRLADTLLAWRRHQFVFVTDIEKMYRQIEVHADDRDLHRILWRRGEVVQEYQLNTVTYGLAAAPFLAIRTLLQLANDEHSRFPLGVAVLRDEVYVDDILTGASSVPEALERRKQLEDICRSGRFPLKKWAANKDVLLEGIPKGDQALKDALTWHSDECHATLGLEWRPREDAFKFTLHQFPESATTKRGILSQAAQLFDPLGWMAPVTVRARCMIQTTWMRHIGWDDRLPEEDVTAWEAFIRELPLLSNIHVPRWVGMTPLNDQTEIHGFADASERAYAAVLYIRTKVGDGVQISLLQAKTKVAPLKQVSLPRLELCAASLLTAVVSHALEVLKLPVSDVHL